jgi:stalled ribosome rescue protein Dom34
MAERPSMSFDMSDSEILGALEDAASEISRRIQQGLSTEVIDRARGGDRGALGPESVEQAAREGRVDTLLMSRGFINTSPDYADHLVGAVFEHGGEVEEVSMEAPNVLDTEGRGVAARLRYDLEH